MSRIPALFWPLLPTTYARCSATNVDDIIGSGVNGHMTSRLTYRTLVVGAWLLASTASTLAAPCGTGAFDAWLDDFKKEAAAKGISQNAIQAGLAGVTQ